MRTTIEEHLLSQLTRRADHGRSWDHLKPFRDQPLQAGLALRTYRALTWLHYARSETQDQFTPFVYYWIAFNALYAVKSDNADENERQAQEKYFAHLLSGEGAQKLVAGALGGTRGPCPCPHE